MSPQSMSFRTFSYRIRSRVVAQLVMVDRLHCLAHPGTALVRVEGVVGTEDDLLRAKNSTSHSVPGSTR
jgi:hypothetical protein